MVWTSARDSTVSRQGGSAAILAVAVIVLVGFLGTSLLSTALISHQSVADYSVGTQARYIAEAGAEWACQQDSETSQPMALADGSFEVVADEDAWISTGTVGGARCTVRCEPIEPEEALVSGLVYVLGSRRDTYSDKVQFRVMNTSDSSITFNKMKVSWESPTAWFQEAYIRVLGGTDYGIVWDNDYNGWVNWANGDIEQFNRDPSVTIPAHRTAEIILDDFRSASSGGYERNMESTEFTIQFFNSSTLVGEITVGLYPE